MVLNISASSPSDQSSYMSVNSDSSMWGSPSSSNMGDVHIKMEPPDSMDVQSPTNSNSSSNNCQKKRKGSGVAGKSIEEELCLICGDRASGYHYNALSCEGCKGFFRRSITRSATYNCKYGGHCEMDMWMRRRCQSCRLRRCREVGMKEECLLSDEQCKARDARRKARQTVVKAKLSEEQQHSPDSNTPPLQEQQCQSVENPLDQLSTQYRQLIESVVLYQDRYELPSAEDVNRVTEVKISDLGRPKELSEVIYKQMAEMTILVTQLVVEFAKHLPGFASIDKDDQILLLKGSAVEVMMLRTARRYDLETDTIVFANGAPYTRDNMRFAGLKDYVDCMFHFCRGMGHLQVDNAEYALLTAICIMSERPGLHDPRRVEQIQEMYVDSLQAYSKIRRRKQKVFFAKLLMVLTELRTLSSEYADVLFNLKVEKGSLPPLLSEYFDVFD